MKWFCSSASERKWPSTSLYFFMYTLMPSALYILVSLLAFLTVKGKVCVSNGILTFGIFCIVSFILQAIFALLYYGRLYSREYGGFFAVWPQICGVLLVITDLVLLMLAARLGTCGDASRILLPGGPHLLLGAVFGNLFIVSFLMPLPIAWKCRKGRGAVFTAATLLQLPGLCVLFCVCAALLLEFAAFADLDGNVKLHILELFGRLLDFFESLSNGVPGGLSTICAVSLVFAAGGYFAHGAMLAGLANMSIKRMFRQEVCICIGVALAVFLLFTGLSIKSAHSCQKLRLQLTEHFGHPVDHDVMEEYREAGRADSNGFWDNFVKASDTMRNVMNNNHISSDGGGKEADGGINRTFAEFDALLESRDKLPPLPKNGKKAVLAESDVICVLSLRVGLALKKNDAGTAMKLWHLARKVSDSALDQGSIDASMCKVMLSDVMICKDIVGQIVQSGLASEAQLKELLNSFSPSEPQNVDMFKRSYYSSAVSSLGFLDGTLPNVRWKEQGHPFLSQAGFLFPQAVWAHGTMMAPYLKMLLNGDNFHVFAAHEPGKAVSGLYVDWFAKVYENANFGMLSGLAWSRVTSALVACELFKSRTGRYPLELSELFPDFLPAVPANPFTNKPLHYRLGNMPVNRAPDAALRKALVIWVDFEDANEPGSIDALNSETPYDIRAYKLL